jgi:hypothetical protein
MPKEKDDPDQRLAALSAKHREHQQEFRRSLAKIPASDLKVGKAFRRAPKKRALVMLASVLANQARASLRETESRLAHLSNKLYLKGRADTLGVEPDTIRNTLHFLCEFFMAEAGRVSFQAQGAMAEAMLKGDDQYDESELPTCEQLRQSIKEIGQQLKKLAKLSPREFRESPEAVALAEQATVLCRLARTNLGEAHRAMRNICTGQLDGQRLVAEILGLDSLSYSWLQFRLSQHWLGHADWLVFQAQELLSRAVTASLQAVTKEACC